MPIERDTQKSTGRRWKDEWLLPGEVTYLNHGSFGPAPKVVQEARQAWTDRLQRQPMDFFLRQMEPALDAATERLAQFVGADAGDLVFVDNATAGMNIVAASVPLSPGDEVLLTDHEYGAVVRLWRKVCQRSGANLVVQKLPQPLTDSEEVAAEFLKGVTDRTRLIVVSHVTSPTAVILPVADICRAARERRIPICIDGPHALAMLPVNLNGLDCDFYTASCHKWLCAPFGTGFLYVAKRRQQQVEPAVVSWGGSVAGRPKSWKDEFHWIGTRDPAGFLSVPAAIEFLDLCGLDMFRRETHALAQYARERIAKLTGLEPFIPDSRDWYGSMIALPLPPGDSLPPKPGYRDPLQDRLWDESRIEVPIVHWHDRRFVRVSCHLYNSREDVDRLVEALAKESV
jgi:isopenicillin-N epimerase